MGLVNLISRFSMNQLMQPPDFWTINNSIGSFRGFINEILAEISWGGSQEMNIAADSLWKLTICVPLVQVEPFRSNEFIQNFLVWYYWRCQILKFMAPVLITYIPTITTSSETCNFSHWKPCHDDWVFQASRQWVLWPPGYETQKALAKNMGPVIMCWFD